MAQSGIAFTTQVPTVYRTHVEQEIDKGAEELIANRSALMGQGDLESRRDALLTRVKLVTLLTDQSEALRRYFVAMNALALGADGEAVGTALADATTGVEGLVSRITKGEVDAAGIKINGQPLSKIVSDVGQLVIGQINNATLKRNLEDHGKAVLSLIGIQRKALERFRSDQTEAERENLLKKVAAQYNAVGKQLPARWSQEWKHSLLFKGKVDPLSTALDAAEALEEAFRALAKGKPTSLARLENAVYLTSAVFKVLNL